MPATSTYPLLPFLSACSDATGGQPKVQKKDYLAAGTYPVIDQGQSPIAGYTDDAGSLYSGELPVVLFGDHTRIFKYVDQPFALGADGVKVLSAKNAVHAKYLYFFFASTEVPSRGYSRHFKILKQSEVPLPPPSEQRRIVEILDQADALRKKRAEADKIADRILPALFYKMFGDPTTNPKGLRKRPLGDLIKVKSGQFLPKKSMDIEGVHPVYGGNGINGYHSEFMFDAPVVVIGRVGAYCGVVHHTEPKSWVTDNALYVSDMDDELSPIYLVEALRHANLNQYAGRAGQPLISGSRIYPVEVLLPEPGGQQSFADATVRLQKNGEKATVTRSTLEQLFSVLLHRAFSGDLTAKWREAHMKELLQEMKLQAQELNG